MALLKRYNGATWGVIGDVADVVNGVKVAGSQLAKDVDGNVDIPYASTDETSAGVVKVRANYGTMINGNGQIYLAKATDALIDGKENLYRPIVPANLDYAVASAIKSLFGIKKIGHGSTSITQNATTVDLSSFGFTSVPTIHVDFNDTGTWSGDEGQIKVQSITTTDFKVSIGGTGHTTPRPVKWTAIEFE